MPFGTYDELQSTVERWLARHDFKEDVADFIYLAEKEMQTRANMRVLDKVEEGNFVEDQAWIDTPSDMLEPRFLRTDSDGGAGGYNVVSIFKWQDVVTHQATTHPSALMHHGNRIYLARVPGDDTGYTLFYKGGFPRLSSEHQTNFILEQFPQCYLYGSLANAAAFIGNDERVPMWVQQAQYWMEELRRSEADSKAGGGRLRIRPDNVDGGNVAVGVRRWPW